MKRMTHVMKRAMTKVMVRALAIASLSAAALAQTAEPVKIGALIPLSGPGAAIGAAFEKGLQTGLAGLPDKRLAGRPFQLKVYDTEGSSNKAGELFRRLADNDEVDVVIGPSFSGEALAISPIANRMKVPTISSAGAEAVTNPATPYMFSVNPHDRLIVGSVLETFKSRNYKRVGLIYSMDGYGQSGGNMLKQLAPAAGIELVAVETFNMQDTSVSPQLLKIQQTNPDVVLVWSNNPGPIIVLRNARDLGLRKPFFVSYANTTNAFPAQAGPAADGVYAIGLAIAVADTLPEADSRKPVLATLAKAHRERYGAAPDLTAGLGYDSVLVLEQALRKVQGPANRDAIRNALIGAKVCGSTGCLQFTDQDHRGHGPNAMALMQVKDGKWRYVP